MKVRKLAVDFSTTPAQWAAIPEFAQSMNAASLWIPHLERFLNRTLSKASATLDASYPDTGRLKSDIRIFIRQEAMHYTLHAAFNDILPRQGYDVAGFERHFQAEFERIFSTKSLAFLCAYCEGFETMGPPMALAWLDEMEDMLEGARPEVIKLWKWHLMEEYEHRTVCHDVFHAIHGGYFLRVYGFFYQLFHLSGFSAMVLRHLLERDWAQMSPAEIKASRRRLRKVRFRIAGRALLRMSRALSPFYTPRNAKEPRMYRSYMAKVEGGFG